MSIRVDTSESIATLTIDRPDVKNALDLATVEAIRDALRTLTRHGLTARIDGDGFVTEQSPETGTPLVPGDHCILKLGRRPVVPAGGLQQ